MAVLPEDEPDFATALESLIEVYVYQWEISTGEIAESLQRQLDLVSAMVGTEMGFAPVDQIPSETPDPPDRPPPTTPLELPPIEAP